MIYIALDLGSDTIKVVAVRITDKDFSILASTNVRSVGIKKGIISDKAMVIESLKLALNEIENKLNIKIDKVILTIPSYENNIISCHGEVEVNDEITGVDVINCFKSAINEIDDDYSEIVTVTPISFKVDGEKCNNPIGKKGKLLETQTIITLSPKELTTMYIDLLKEINVEVIDLSLNPISDFYMVKKDEFKDNVGALVNIGDNKTEIGIFNKGLLVNSDILTFGSNKIDMDLKYVYNVDKNIARNIKDNFVVANHNYAQNESIKITTLAGEEKTISSSEASEVTEARIEDILKNVKNSLINLTKKDLSYIIITGGITNIPGFDYMVEQTFGDITYTENMNILGARDNIYITSVGATMYYYDKLKTRGISYTMYDNINNKDFSGILDNIKMFLGNN